ncbi:hypothetical protein [Selenomonas ruminantium]|uniref:Uncharacterized protein n=1 Tax=Selenomonas ruminantium TaxID=971 RepID=A0A1H3YV02_SELRU|nr:hypothetical protein [Selenomonas ruminantium]SEA15395.1 hypothetical protein SAMN05660648_02153 [Selenomonas ruminantium]
MDVNLTTKAKKLYDCIREKGGGVLEEWRMLDKTGMSHGSFVAARKELVAAGLLLLGKNVRKTTYQLVELTSQKLTSQELTCQKPVAETLTCQTPAAKPMEIQPPPSPEAVVTPAGGRGRKGRKKAEKQAFEVQEAIMPRVVGEFADFDDWLLALNEELGGCVDVSQSLVSNSDYTVFSPEYGGEDSYTIRENEDGGITVD